MRLFIAVNLSEECKSYIADIASSLKRISRKGRPVRKSNFHITLEFLGQMEKERTAGIVRAMETISSSPFTLSLSGKTGYFKRRDGRTYFLSPERSEDLEALQFSLHAALSERGFALEKRKFIPHITLMRDAYIPQDIPSFESFDESVTSFALMRSDRIKGEMVYTTVYEKLLDDPGII